MRRLVFLGPALIAACASAPAEPPVHGAVQGHICTAVGTERFIGQPGTSGSGAAVLRATNSAVLRWAPPGAMLTMDFSESRVTIWLGPEQKITKIACG